ncbi:Glycosyl hydrolase family protein [Perilla frutescens var. frutescens]|nr:Glycosyl hydrolase family protein [Perilla frutescens var. frutescens]
MRVHNHSRRSSFSPFCFCTTIIIIFLSTNSQSDATPPFSCDPSNPSTRSLPFCNTHLPIAARVNDVVSRLTLDEKIQQLVNTAAAIPRLNISAYEWWSEALHGVSRHGRGVSFNGSIKSATMFPQIILSAASFDSHLWFRIAQAIGEESRAVFNAGQGKGMTFWAPNINIFRDPRWGRGQETAGEDPLVAAKYAVAYVRGLQGDSFEGGKMKTTADGGLMASACCKHYTAHDLDNWNGVNRYIFDAKVSKQDMADTFQPPFKACVEEGKASGIMCAYNRVNGIPSCADHNLLTTTARHQWGFQGYIASDCDAVAIIHDMQGYAKEPEDAVADVLKAGMDVNCGSYLAKYTKSAVEKKKVSEVDIDRALHNLFSIRMRLGLFDGDTSKLKYGNINGSHVCSNQHLHLALEAARSGIVLLKNDVALLPLSKDNTKSLALIGPNANTSNTFVGNYEGRPCKNITILQAIENLYGISTKYNQGCNSANCTSALIDEAVAIAKEADHVVLVMGLDQTLEREKLDRLDLGLPGHQENLITAVADAARKPVVLVLLCGGPVDVSFAKQNPKIGSILWAGYPGEAGGVAVAETLFGDNNPGGKLPVTWYPKDFNQVAMTDMRMRPDPSTGYPGRTYRFYTGPKVYEFGYGLSYTNYSYKFISLSRSNLFLNSSSHVERCGSSHSQTVSVSKLGVKSCKSMMFSAKVRVTNHGDMAGNHPALLFIRSPNDDSRRLVGFETVRLSPRGSREIRFAINPCERFSHADEDGLMNITCKGLRTMSTGQKKSTLDGSENPLPSEIEQAKISEVRQQIGPQSGNLAIYCTDAAIARYLRARNWNVKKTVKMLKATLKWRLEYKPEDICWDDIAAEAETGKIYVANYKDKNGRPVLIMRPRCQNSKSIKGQIQYLVYCMENAILDLPPDQEQMIWMIDFHGFNLSHISIKVTRETAHVLQEHFPERLGIAILYNPPKIFEPFWMVAKPFLEAKTANKVKFVYADDPNTNKVMNELFDMEVVESAFGGKDNSDFNITKYAERMREDDKRTLSFWKTEGYSDTTPPSPPPALIASPSSENLNSESDSKKSDEQPKKSSSTGEEDKSTTVDESVTVKNS